MRVANIKKPKGLEPPTVVATKSSMDMVAGFMLGVLTSVGASSDWLQQGSHNEFSMCQVPSSRFGCILSSGQNLEKVTRPCPDGLDRQSFSPSFMDFELYKPSTFSMGPPAFVTSLYAYFLEAAYLRAEILVMEEARVESALSLLEEEQKRLQVSVS